MSSLATANGRSSRTRSERNSNGATLATLVSGFSEAEAKALLALVPAFSTQRFAETYRHFSLGTPWFHEAWYEAYDNPDLARLYVQGPREHAKRTTE